MTDEQLEGILRKTDLNEYMPIIDNYIYYCKKPVKSRISRGDGTYRYSVDEYEFLLITMAMKSKVLFCAGTQMIYIGLY